MRPRIDETDVKIIRILQEDPRTTYLQLAQDCHISIDSVRRRYERLKNEGVVIREMLSLHPKAMGNECLTWLGIVTKPGGEKEVLESLKQKHGVMMNFVEIGKYNIRSLLAVKHVTDLASFVDTLKKIPDINDIDVMIWSGIENMAYPRNLVIDTFPGESDEETSAKSGGHGTRVKTSTTSYFNGTQKQVDLPLSTLCPSIDKTDETILNELSRNARIPFSTIAKQIGISTKTVICRFKKLRKDWVLYTTLTIDLRKIGYSGYVSYNIKVSSKSWVNDVFNGIVKIPNVIAALKLIGPYDINIVAPFSSPQQLIKIHNSISEIPGVERIDQQIGDSMDIWPAG